MEPGPFRTEFLGTSGRIAGARIGDYAQTAGKTREYFELQNGKQPGDPQKAVEAIVAERDQNGPFVDLFDFCERVDGKNANKGCMESLIKAGAFDSISKGHGRATLLAALEDAMANGAKQRQDRDCKDSEDDAASGQQDLPLGLVRQDEPRNPRR